jgi:hypothetical protein
MSGEKVMKNLKLLIVALLAFVLTSGLVSLPTSARGALAQNQGSTALERGYRTGYSDGYNAGFKDVADHAASDFRSKVEYQHADRAYVEAWGPLEDYRDGYQQGYETGYGMGYEGQPFNSAIPTGFKRRGTPGTQDNAATVDAAKRTANTTAKQNAPNPDAPANASPNLNGTVSIPHDTILVVELQNNLSSDVSQRGDRFQARVVGPREYEGAMLDGTVTLVKRPGKVKGVAELQLSFDQIRLPDNRSADFHAEVVEVLGRGSDAGQVDKEGGVKGRDSTKDDVAKVGATTGVGAIIGAIAGGGKGAAIGAAIGAGVGTGGVLSSGGKELRIDRGEQLKIRASNDTSIQ